jgi:hypothetical protein
MWDVRRLCVARARATALRHRQPCADHITIIPGLEDRAPIDFGPGFIDNVPVGSDNILQVGPSERIEDHGADLKEQSVLSE